MACEDTGLAIGLKPGLTIVLAARTASEHAVESAGVFSISTPSCRRFEALERGRIRYFAMIFTSTRLRRRWSPIQKWNSAGRSPEINVRLARS
jgi:hypothetical protein